MRLIIITFLSIIFFGFTPWQTDIQKAEQAAKTEHKLIILNFSGSDWCGPCIRLHKEIFESEVFTKFSDEHLVLLNADFPRLKKNQLPKEQQKKNDKLAEIYNKDGVFPLTVLLNSEGKVLKKWEGFPKESADELINEINDVADAIK